MWLWLLPAAAGRSAALGRPRADRPCRAAALAWPGLAGPPRCGAGQPIGRGSLLPLPRAGKPVPGPAGRHTLPRATRPAVLLRGAARAPCAGAATLRGAANELAHSPQECPTVGRPSAFLGRSPNSKRGRAWCRPAARAARDPGQARRLAGPVLDKPRCAAAAARQPALGQVLAQGRRGVSVLILSCTWPAGVGSVAVRWEVATLLGGFGGGGWWLVGGRRKLTACRWCRSSHLRR